jgi:hypothetical protein
MEMCIAYAETHKDKSIAKISAKIEKYCTSKIPNAFWSREKYLISLPFDPLKNTVPQKK